MESSTPTPPLLHRAIAPFPAAVHAIEYGYQFPKAVQHLRRRLQAVYDELTKS